MKQGLSDPRPNTSIDMLATSYIPNVRLMGDKDLKLLTSPYLSSSVSLLGSSRSPSSTDNTDMWTDRAPRGSYKDYPPTFISIGEAEALKREAEQLFNLMENDGVKVTLDKQPDASHDFLGVPIIPNDKARENAITRACEWIEGQDRAAVYSM
jgi:acetyl esterase/lipase